MSTALNNDLFGLIKETLGVRRAPLPALCAMNAPLERSCTHAAPREGEGNSFGRLIESIIRAVGIIALWWGRVFGSRFGFFCLKKTKSDSA
jgi:hypothetical protein